MTSLRDHRTPLVNTIPDLKKTSHFLFLIDVSRSYENQSKSNKKLLCSPFKSYKFFFAGKQLLENTTQTIFKTSGKFLLLFIWINKTLMINKKLIHKTFLKSLP